MITEEINKRKFRDMVKSTGGGFIYHEDGKLYKLDKMYANDMYTKKRIYHDSKDINVDQIKKLSDLRFAITHSSLPEGILIYDHEPVGVIYPHYFEGYKELSEVYNEENELMLSNLRKAVNNNLELTAHDIYNADFSAQNILYKGNDVQLIDLDGKYIKDSSICDYNEVYSYFMEDLFKIIYNKLVLIYGKENHDMIRHELVNIFPDPRKGYTESTPLEVIDKIERILK